MRRIVPVAGIILALGASCPAAFAVAAAPVAVSAPAPAPAPAPAGAPAAPNALPDITAGAYVLADYDTGRILAAKAPHDRLRPASTQKILTALALLPVLDPSALHVSAASDLGNLAVAEPGASAVGVRPGLTYRIADLWNGVFLRSGNDAIATLATLAGGLPHTLDLMRATLTRLHATDTTIVNADGYDADGQLSSAFDLALMARAGLADPAFRAYCSLPHARFPAKDGTTYAIDNENRLLGKYQGMIGVKNGYTTQAGHTFVGAAQRGDRTLIVTVLQAGPDIYTQTAKLLDWGFAAPIPGRDAAVLPSADPGPAGLLLKPGTSAANPAPGTNPASGTVSGAAGSEPGAQARKATAAPKPAASHGSSTPTIGLAAFGSILGLLAALRARVVIKARMARNRRGGVPGF